MFIPPKGSAVSTALEAFASWTFTQECEIPQDIYGMLVEGEQVYCAYKTIRDVAIFTTKRLIVRDAQGVTGKKIETYSLPWKAVNMWSSENAGTFDINTEVELWTRAGHIKINLKKGIDIRKLDHLIAHCVING